MANIPLRFPNSTSPLLWGELPLEIWHTIISSIRPYKRKGMLTTSKWFRDLYWETKENAHFSSSWPCLVKPESIDRIITLSANSIVNLSICDINLPGFNYKLPRIKYLQLEKVGIAIKSISKLTTLQTLILRENSIRDSDLACITSLSSLKEIDIDGIYLTDLSVLYYSHFNLKECNINCGGSGSTLIALAGQPIQTLNISSKMAINQTGLSQIDFSNLGTLRIKNCEVLEPVALNLIVQAINLEVLWLHDYRKANFSLLEKLKKLRELSLVGSTIEDNHLPHLKLQQLEVLNMSRSPTITDVGVYNYCKSPPKSFRYLIIIDCPLLEVYSLYNYLIYDGKKWMRKL